MKVNKRDLALLRRRAPIFSFKGEKDKKKYTVELFLSTGDYALLEGENNKTAEQKNNDRLQVVSNIFKRKYDFMDVKWLSENMDYHLISCVCTDIIVYCNTTLDNLQEMDLVKKKKTRRKVRRLLKRLLASSRLFPWQQR